MSRHYLSVLALVFRASLLAIVLFFGLSSLEVASAAGQCNGPTAGRRVYDCAGLLSTSEIASIETHAAAVAQAGAPTVVYLQVQKATYAQTYQDAADLMSRWDVESHPGAKDGLVMFLNLLPDNLRHGEVVLYAGASQAEGPLSQTTLAHIYSDTMLPQLQQGNTAQGILLGLDAVADALRADPPQSDGMLMGAGFLRLPANIIASLICVLAVVFALKIRPLRPRVRRKDRRTTPPGTLTPDVVGALVRGRIQAESIQAMLLYMACHGILAIEPADKGQVVLHLLTHKKKLSGIQEQVWMLLSRVADAQQRVSSSDLGQLDEHWLSVAAAIRRELLRHQWYDQQAGFRRIWLLLASMLLLVFSGVDAVATLVAQEPWGWLGSGLLFGCGVWVLFWAMRMPHTTSQGEKIAAQWRAYLAGVKATPAVLKDRTQLDIALPYVLAMGAGRRFSRRLRLAEVQGYKPAWLHEVRGTHAQDGRCAAAWSAFQRQFVPVLALDRSNAMVIGWRGGFVGGRRGVGGGGGGGGAGAGGAGAGGSF